MENENKFQTSDFLLAAFLYAKGIILLSVHDSLTDSRRKVFVFDSPPSSLLSSFQSGSAEVNVNALANAQNTLRTKLREVA